MVSSSGSTRHGFILSAIHWRRAIGIWAAEIVKLAGSYAGKVERWRSGSGSSGPDACQPLTRDPNDATLLARRMAALDLDSNDYRYWGNLGIYYKWAPGNEAKSAPALRRAIELGSKLAETKQSDLSARANLAEYKARLGDAKGALAEIDRIPVTARAQFTARIATVYELTGDRNKAIALIRANLKSPASLNQIKDSPDLAALWREGKFQ